MENKQRSPAASFLLRCLRSNGFYLAAITIFLIAFITLVINDRHLTTQNYRMSILFPMVVPGVMLAAVGPLLIGGIIDLSCAWQATFSSLFFAKVMQFFALSTAIPVAAQWPLALLITLALGAVYGLINIFFTNVMNFMPFISTIAMMSVFKGLGGVWSSMNDVAINNASFTKLSSIAFFNTVPLLFVFMIVLVAVYSYILVYTRFGRSAYMCGGNPVAARLAGLNPKRVRASLFINSGVISALAGVTWAAQRKLGNPQNLAQAAPNFTALTALILGGTSFTGGSGGVSVGIIALLLVTVFDNGITMLSYAGGRQTYGSYVNIVLKGLILVVALMMDGVKASRAKRALVVAAMKGHEKRRAEADAIAQQ